MQRTNWFLFLYLATAFILAVGANIFSATAGPTDKRAVLALIAVYLLMPLVAIGSVITAVYLWLRSQGLRYAHLITMYLVLIGNFSVLIADPDRPEFLLCWDCDGDLAWARLIVPGTLFMLVAPLFVKTHYDVFGESS